MMIRQRVYPPLMTTSISYNDINEGGQGEYEDEISPMSKADSEDDTDYFG